MLLRQLSVAAVLTTQCSGLVLLPSLTPRSTGLRMAEAPSQQNFDNDM